MSWSHDLSALSSIKKSVDWLNNQEFTAHSNVITDVKDRILNNITWYSLLQLKTYPTQNM